MKFSIRNGIPLMFLAGIVTLTASAAPRHPNVASLSKNRREIFLTAMQWGDQTYNPQAKLCAKPASPDHGEGRVSPYLMVRDTTWYALGLLLRDQRGDRDRAADILRTVLSNQYREPGKPWDGTFRRTPDEPEPGDDAVMWLAFDPNWRVFIGTTFAVILNEYPDRIPVDLGPKLIESINYAIAGEMKEGRLLPSYSNISLMYGFLWNFAAVYGNKPEWLAPAAKWQEDTYKLYRQHDAFFEYNSPTYAGVDFFALALWRDYGFTPQMREMGSEMEAGLWSAMADMYNANLRNISGPYDRSYGMDMQSYVSVTGIWLRTVLGADKAPLTKFDPPVDHITDLWFTSPIVILDTKIPPGAMKSFRNLQAEHRVYRYITDERIATAWIGRNVVYGGEITGHTKNVDEYSQFHPATVQWQMPDGKIGWIQLTRCPMIDASADKEGIVISANGDVSFRISAPGAVASNIKSGEWALPGLTVSIETDSKGFTTNLHDRSVDLTYTGMTSMTLKIKSMRK